MVGEKVSWLVGWVVGWALVVVELGEVELWEVVLGV